VHQRQAGLFRERYDAIYSDRRYETCFHYGRGRLHDVIDRWIPAPGQGRRLLDVGCGTGHHLARWSGAGYVCSGLDAADEMLAEARGRNPGLCIEKGDVYGLPFGDSSFDVVIAIELLRYLAEVPAALREVARVLRPGGQFVATVMSPYSMSGYPILNLLTGRFAVPGFVHLKQHFHSRRAIIQMLRQSGLHYEEVCGVAFVTAPQKVAERLAPSMLRRSLELLEPVDRLLSALPALADLALHVVFRARRI